MSERLILAVVAATSLLALLRGRRRLREAAAALGLLLEAVGATVLFFAANVGLGAAVVLVARRVWFYTTLYDVADVSLLALSLVQGVAVTVWRRRR